MPKRKVSAAGVGVGESGTGGAAGRDVTRPPHCSPLCLSPCRLARMERRRRSPSAAPRGCRPSPPLPRWTRSRRRPRERINHQTEKCRQKGRGEQRANRRKWLTSKLQICLRKTERQRTRSEEHACMDVPADCERQMSNWIFYVAD